MRDLEFIPGSRGFRQNDVVARRSEPPFPTHGGQDDVSLTNSLKSMDMHVILYVSRHLQTYIYIYPSVFRFTQNNSFSRTSCRLDRSLTL